MLSAFTGADVFDGRRLLTDHALILRGGRVEALCPAVDLPRGVEVTRLPGGTLAPGYVDLQVNGGGGVQFNDAPEAATLATIAAAHAALGATAILPTLITDTPEATRRAIAAVEEAIAQRVPGVVGLHLEGPHLSPARAGAHDPRLIRPLEDDDLALLIAAARRLPVLKVTLAPEAVEAGRIRALVAAGILVALGHSEATLAAARAAMEEGVRTVTHLFNAMSQIGSREPGLAGAALALGGLSAGLIADLVHVHPETLALACRAKRGPGRLHLVSDAMALAGTARDAFTLGGRRITRREGRLTLADGTLAGADLDLTTAVRNMVRVVGLPLAEALAMATSVPAGLIGAGARLGHITPGRAADFNWLDSGFRLAGVWRGGQRIAGP